MLSCLVAQVGVLSHILTVKTDVPEDPDGVPTIAHIKLAQPDWRANPVGRDPAEIDHVHGPIPFCAWSGPLYKAVSSPCGMLFVMIVGPPEVGVIINELHDMPYTDGTLIRPMVTIALSLPVDAEAFRLYPR